MVDVTNSSSGSSSASGIAPDDDSYDDADADAGSSSPAASGGVGTGGPASNLVNAADSNAGGVLVDAEDGTEEWPLSAAGDQQEAGRLSLPAPSVPIFEGITYESADGQPWRPPARQPAAKKQQVCLNAVRLLRLVSLLVRACLCGWVRVVGVCVRLGTRRDRQSISCGGLQRIPPTSSIPFPPLPPAAG